MSDLEQTDYTTCPGGGEHCQHRSSASVGAIWGLATDEPQEVADQYRCCKCGEEWWKIATFRLREDCYWASHQKVEWGPARGISESVRWARKPW